MGHLANFVGGDDTTLNTAWDWFEAAVATTYMVYPVNDGKNPDYPQDTARERCIAYMKNLQSGKEMTTDVLMEHCWREHKSKYPDL